MGNLAGAEFIKPGNAPTKPAVFVNDEITPLAPKDGWCGKRHSIFECGRKIKENTLNRRKQLYLAKKTAYHPQTELECHRIFTLWV